MPKTGLREFDIRQLRVKFQIEMVLCSSDHPTLLASWYEDCSSNSFAVTGICDSSKSREQHHRRVNESFFGPEINTFEEFSKFVH